MKWGTQKTFLKVKNVVVNGDTAGYNEIMAIVQDDVIARVRAKVPKDFQKDVLQEICLSVFVHLVDYVSKYETLPCSIRNAWLSKIASSKINDFWRNYYRYYMDNNKDSSRRVFSLVELAFPSEDEETEEGAEFDIAFHDTDLDNVANIVPEHLPLLEIGEICSMRVSPDRILAFLFQRYLFEKNKNAKPKQTVEILSDYTLGELYSIFLNSLSFNKTVRSQLKNAMSALHGVLEQKDKDSDKFMFQIDFRLNAKQVTDSYYTINQKLHR